jgi:hypothetical protein
VVGAGPVPADGSAAISVERSGSAGAETAAACFLGGGPATSGAEAASGG